MGLIVKNQHGNTSYTVQNNINVYDANDHNALYNDMFRASSNHFINFGGGEEGHVRLGAISPNPTTAPIATDSGNAGNLSGSFLYKYQAYNLSGHSDSSPASSSVAVSGKSIIVQISQLAGTNITGFDLYRSEDAGSSWQLVARIPSEDGAAVTYEDNNPYQAGKAINNSNTSGVTAYYQGIIRCQKFTLLSGQTLNVSDAQLNAAVWGTFSSNSLNYMPGQLVIIANDKITIQGTINGVGKFYDMRNSTRSGYDASSDGNTNGVASGGAVRPGAGYNIVSFHKFRANTIRDLMNSVGAACSSNGGLLSKGGASSVLMARNEIELSGGTINSTGEINGGAGGLVVLASNFVNTGSGTITANGGNGTTGGGGGGGIILIHAKNYKTGATVTVNGGTGAAGTSYGGGFGGTGGTPSSSGGAGIIAFQSLAQLMPF